MKKTNWFWIVIAAVCLCGCNGNLHAPDTTSPPRPRKLVQLQPGNHQGVWKTDELAVKYVYQMTPETLKISGTVELVGGFSLCCNAVKRLVIRVVFFDIQENEIKSEFFYSPSNNHPIQLLPMNFDRNFSIPAGTSTISFDYDGELISGGQGPGRVTIWYSPF